MERTVLVEKSSIGSNQQSDRVALKRIDLVQERPEISRVIWGCIDPEVPERVGQIHDHESARDCWAIFTAQAWTPNQRERSTVDSLPHSFLSGLTTDGSPDEQ